MSILNFLHLEADAIAENPVVIPFDWTVRDRIPDNVVLEPQIIIYPLTVQTWFRIKPLIAEISPDDYVKLLNSKCPAPEWEIVNLMDKYDAILMQILYLGLHNKPGEMDEWMKNVLADNCTWSDIFILINAVLFRIGQQSFCKSITVLQNVSPLTEMEIIAAQNNLESWKTAQAAQ